MLSPSDSRVPPRRGPRRCRSARFAQGAPAALGFALPAVIAFSIACFFLTATLFPIDPSDPRIAYPESRRVFDRGGRLLREAVNERGFRAQWVSLAEIAPDLLRATIAVEDGRFYGHPGVDPVAVFRAVTGNLTATHPFSGASTITMQLARILFGHERTVAGKLGQAWDALRLEHLWSKDAILEQYLNRVPYGSGCVGVGSASRRYFGKPASHLSLAESALLAALPQSPVTLDPVRYPEAAERRRRLVLEQMRTSAVASPQEVSAALDLVPSVNSTPPAIRAGHFTDLVLARTTLTGDIGTSLDGELNDVVERIVADHVDLYRDKGITNAAAIVLDNETAEILALVGSRDWSDADAGAVNGALAPRQPGSTLKPFLYALAFTLGYSQASVLADVETDYYGTDRTLYVPMNYSRQFRGPVLAREALAYSLNVPAVRLLREVGVRPFLQNLRSLGFSGLLQSADHYGLGLVLGNGEVTLLQIAGAYSTLGRGGVYREPAPFRAGGNADAVRIYDPAVAWLVTAILADEETRTQAFGMLNPLVLGVPMAIKTGTSNEWRDLWTVGYNARYTVAVWAGNFSAAPMDHVSGSVGAGALFRRVVDVVLARDTQPSQLPPRPEGITTVVVCADSGLTPTDACPSTSVVEIRNESMRPSCSVHRHVRIDIRNGLLASPSTPPASIAERIVAYLPPVFDDWLSSKGYSQPPTEVSRLGTNPGGVLAIRSPREGDVYILEPGYDNRTQTIALQAEAAPSVRNVTWYVDGQPIGTVPWPFDSMWQLVAGEHVLEARTEDHEGPRVQFSVR
jgi:penicillin-binding protein 1C